jgi:hypothetical protein
VERLVNVGVLPGRGQELAQVEQRSGHVILDGMFIGGGGEAVRLGAAQPAMIGCPAE